MDSVVSMYTVLVAEVDRVVGVPLQLLKCLDLSVVECTVAEVDMNAVMLVEVDAFE